MCGDKYANEVDLDNLQCVLQNYVAGNMNILRIN